MSEEFADASEFGWPPGNWPVTVTTARGTTYRRKQEDYSHGELISVRYESEDGSATLTVYND
ncbi:MAG: hypothetical protein QOH39_3039 [Verrucomicrobiota bacterium]|jgi:hypothetical protein